jgi:hypothetical protein
MFDGVKTDIDEQVVWLVIEVCDPDECELFGLPRIHGVYTDHDLANKRWREFGDVAQLQVALNVPLNQPILEG